MTTTVGGIDTILKCISSEADAAVKNILTDAKRKADDIIKSAEEEAAEILESAESMAKYIRSDIADRESISIEHNEKQRILAEKQNLINSIVNDSVSEIKSSDEKYFSVITSLIKSHVDSEHLATIYFSKNDLERFPDSINSLLKGYTNLKVETASDIEYGFILSGGSGSIVDNCTISAIVESRLDAIKEAVQRILF